MRKTYALTRRAVTVLSAVALLAVLFLTAIGTVAQQPEGSGNLLTADGLAGGSQSVTAYKLTGVDCSDLWDMTFGASTYANATVGTVGYMDGVVANLVDGKTDNVYTASTQYVRYDYDYAAASAMNRRLALLVNIGAKKDITSIRIDMAQQWKNNALQDNAVYDCSIYAGNTADVAELIKADNFVTNYTATAKMRAAEMALPNATGVQYVLIVFNKISSDAGATGSVTEGTYGDAHLPATYAGQGSGSDHGSLRLAELTVKGVDYVEPLTRPTTNLLTSEKLPVGTQSVMPLKLTGVDYSDLWDMTFTASTYANATVGNIGYTDGAVDNLVDGKINDVYTASTKYVKYDYAYAASAAIGRRLAVLIDLGSQADLNAVWIDMAQQWKNNALQDNAVYDCSVYVGNTNEVPALLSAERFVTNYTATEKTRAAAIPLMGVTDVRYILIVFNKLSADPGATGSATEGTYGDNHLPATYAGQGSGSDYGSLLLAEITVDGTLKTEPTPPPAQRDNILTETALTSGIQNIFAYKYAINGAALWDVDFTSYNYGEAVPLTQNRWPAIGTKPLPTLADGDYNGNVQAEFGEINNHANIVNRRLALLVDLGGRYDIDGIKLRAPALQQHAFYDYTVFAGTIDDATELATDKYRVGQYTSTVQTSVAALDFNTAKNVQYVLIIFNKLSTDPGSAGSPTDGMYGSDTCATSYADGTVKLSELEIFGTENDEYMFRRYVDADTGVTVTMLGVKGSAVIDSFELVKKNLTAAQRSVIQNRDGRIPVDGLYHLAFKDDQGQEITDLSGWDCTVTLPLTNGSEYLYMLNDKQAPIRAAATVDYQKELMTYTLADGEAQADFILASVVCNGTLPKNLLSLDAIESGEQSIVSYNVENPNLKVWDNTYPYRYGKILPRESSDGPTATAKALVDGNLKAKTHQYGFGAKGLNGMDDRASLEAVLSRRLSLFVDLGKRCTLSSVDLVMSKADNAKFSVYDCSVYAGLESDPAELLKSANLVGRFETKIYGGDVHIKLPNVTNVKYVMIVFNKTSGDPGNANTFSAGMYGNNYLRGEAWCNGAANLSELIIGGTPLSADCDTFTDEESGITVDMVSYSKTSRITSMKVTKTPLTDGQKRIIEEEEGLIAPNGLYHILFYDADGNPVLDMKDREFTISFPVETGDEAVYVLNEFMLPTFLGTVFDLQNNRLYYECTENDFYFDFIWATSGEAMDVPQDVTPASGGVSPWIVVAIAAGACVVVAGVVVLILLKVRKPKKTN